MKDELHAEVHSLANTRDKFVKLRTILLNKIHAHLKGAGYESRKEAYDHLANLKKVLSLEWSVAMQIELEVIVNEILNLTAGITKLEKEIDCRKEDQFEKVGGRNRSKPMAKHHLSGRDERQIS